MGKLVRQSKADYLYRYEKTQRVRHKIETMLPHA
jgi:hypothetical protein